MKTLLKKGAKKGRNHCFLDSLSLSLTNLKANVFERELCSKVLTEAFLLFLLILAWNQKQKCS